MILNMKSNTIACIFFPIEMKCWLWMKIGWTPEWTLVSDVITLKLIVWEQRVQDWYRSRCGAYRASVVRDPCPQPDPSFLPCVNGSHLQDRCLLLHHRRCHNSTFHLFTSNLFRSVALKLKNLKIWKNWKIEKIEKIEKIDKIDKIEKLK